MLEAQLLDYDLQRQLHDDLNKIKVFRGYGGSPDQGTHVLDERESCTMSQVVKCLRADIRYFKWRNGVVGHTTVIWSAREEDQDCCQFEDARDLLTAIDDNDNSLPPSLVYAVAALLEGCSFVNGYPSNAAKCTGLDDLARQTLGVYCLGTQFQTSIASLDHLERMGHLVVQQQQQPQQQNHDDDAVQHTTSLGFLSQPHTTVTYTQSSDALRVAPFMIDVAVWCDFFSAKGWPLDRVTKALNYFFSSGQSFLQLQELKSQAQAAAESKGGGGGGEADSAMKKKRVRIRPEEKTTEWAIPDDASILCAGLACVDMQLNQATGGDGGESIETFEGEKSIGGGSVSMACKTLARLCHGAPLDEDNFMQVTPPVINSVIPLCKIGNDDTGHKLINLLEHCGSACRNVNTKFSKEARKRDTTARTALAVLPIYKDGRRGCFFDAASNATFSPREMIQMIHSLSSPNLSGAPQLDTSQLSDDELDEYQDRVGGATPAYGAFLFGYPHLLPQLQGEALARVMLEARKTMIEGGIVALDLNGVPDGTFARNGALRTVNDLRNDAVIGPALEHVDLLHMNEDELMLLTGCKIRNTADSQLNDEFAIAGAINLFLLCGVGIVAVTRGKKGSFVSCNDEKRFEQSPMLPASWVDCTAKINATNLPRDTIINTNGAGDSFTAGLLVAAMLRHTGMTVLVLNDSMSSDFGQALASPIAAASPSPKKKLTPYQLYMRENYVMLKQQCKDDKKAIFTKCHEMWENETEEVKAMYERKAKDEGQVLSPDKSEISTRLVHDFDAMDASTPRAVDRSYDSQGDGKNLYMTNRALNLESAVQFASLVAAHHVDVSTRDDLHIDVSRLLDRSLIIQEGLEEI